MARVRFKTRLARLGFDDYDKYLRSKHWKQVRSALDKNPRYRFCLICWYKPPIIHHRSYKHLGKERWNELIPLCAMHHNTLHDYLRENRRIRLENMKMILVNCFGFPPEEAMNRLQPFMSNSGMVVIDVVAPTGDKKQKITQEGQPCRKCGAPVEKRTHKKPPDSDTAYYFEWWFKCENCNTLYMVEAAKRYH